MKPLDILPAALIGAAVSVSAAIGPAGAGERDTTWRAGDAVRVAGWCRSHAAAAALAVAPDESAIAALLRAGRCRALPPPLVGWLPPLRLTAWLSAHADPMAGGRPVSVWAARLQAGAVARQVYVVLPDRGGPHRAVERRGA